ncbi:MAG: hypothetical protein NTW21_41120 [Verrucomicrobia bacterium]|nr:hypothetical protein [Verrucomicrobiota bacterium]
MADIALDPPLKLLIDYAEIRELLVFSENIPAGCLEMSAIFDWTNPPPGASLVVP